MTGKFANNSKSPIRSSTKTGLLNGLVVELFIYEPLNMSTLATETGMRISVHNQSIVPPFSSGISVATGTHTMVDVFRKFSSHLGKPYSECTEGIDATYPSEMVKLVFETGLAYTQVNCFFSCYQFYLIERCNCFDVSFSFPFRVFLERNIPACVNISQITCDSQVKCKIQLYSR